MTRTVLPASTFPDVLIANGTTYLALPMESHLAIYSSDYGWQSPILLAAPGSWPRLLQHPSGVLLCAYKLSTTDPVAPNCLAIANISTAQVEKTQIPAFWNSPICWRDDGLIAVQMTEGCEVWGGYWPTFPADKNFIRIGVGTGIAQWLSGSLWTWDELGVTAQPVYINNASVSQANQGGVSVTLGQAGGVLDSGTITNNPRPALAADGSLSCVYWSQDSHGATGTVLYQGVTAADLKPAPPILPTIPPFLEPKILASYDTGHAKGDNGVVQPTDFALWRFSDGKDFPYFDLEQEEPVTAHPCIAYCDIADIGPLAVLRPGDIAAVNVYPTAGQPLADLGAAALATIHLLVSRGLFVNLVGCAWNRLGTLSDQLVLDGMKLVRDLADEPGVIGVEWFGLNRGTSLGYFKPLYQQAVDLSSSPGWPEWPAAPVPPPTPHGLAARKILLSR